MKKIIDSILPFIDFAIKTDVNIGGTSFDRMLSVPEFLSQEITDLFSKKSNGELIDLIYSLFEEGLPINFYKINPIDLYIPLVEPMQYAALVYAMNKNIPELNKILNIDPVKREIYGRVTVVDYDSITDLIQIAEDTRNDKIVYVAMINSGEGIKFEELSTLMYINAVEEGVAVNNNFIVQTDRESIHDEYVIPKNISTQPKVKQPKTSEIEDILTVLLTGSQKGTKSIPCLVGLSGVAKSAIVKSVANKLNKRMVDFRAAFLDRLDMEGMYYAVDGNNNAIKTDDFKVAQKYSTQANLGDFVKCSDQYIEFASRMLEKLKAIKSGDKQYTNVIEEFKEAGIIVEGVSSPIDELIEKFTEESKPVVLFFDEIIRAKKKILDLFTIMLDSKKFHELTFYKSHIVAAANTPYGMTNIEDGEELFVKQTLQEPAIFNRLSIINVHPKTVYPGWISYIKEQKWHPLIIAYVSGDPNRAYDLDYLNGRASVDEKRQTNYATFRAWELVNRLFTAYTKNGFLSSEAISAILGVSAGPFIDFLKQKGVKFSETTPSNLKIKDDEMLAILESNIEAGVPTGLYGPTGFGKCIVGGSYILYNNEIIKIEELKYDDFGFTKCKGLIENSEKKDLVEYNYKEIVHNTVKIITEDNLSLEGSLNHSVKVLKNEIKWSSLSQISKGDTVLLKRNKHYSCERDLNYWTKGFILGDGTISEDRIGFSFHKDFEETVKNIIEKEFNLIKEDSFKGRQIRDGFYRRYKKGDVITYQCYGLNISFSKNWYEKLSINQFFNKLAGYIDAEGQINTISGYIELGWEKEEIIDGIQNSLALLGFYGRKYYKHNPEYNKGYTYLVYGREESIEIAKIIKPLVRLKVNQIESLINLEISSDQNIIQCEYIQKDLKEIYTAARKKSGYSGRVFSKKVCPLWFKELRDKKQFSIRVLEFCKTFNVEPTNNIKELCKYKFAVIKDVIVYDKQEVVYDVTVPETHEFISNGFISHNTTRIEDVKSAKGYEIKVIQMSQKSLSDIMGAPSIVDTSVYITGDVYNNLNLKATAEFNQLLDETLEEVKDLPKKVTIRAPQYEVKEALDIVRKRRAAGEKNCKLILVFDEVNRIAPGSEAVQSAVFEAISDNSFGGIPFNSDEVSVVCAANVNFDNEETKKDEIDKKLELIYGLVHFYSTT